MIHCLQRKLTMGCVASANNADDSMSAMRGPHAELPRVRRSTRAFPGEVDTGSPQEMRPNKKPRA